MVFLDMHGLRHINKIITFKISDNDNIVNTK